MTPTPVAPSPPFAGSPWFLVGLIGVVTLLLAVGLLTGQVSFKSRDVRRSAARGMMTMDAVLSGQERRSAIEYTMDGEHEVVLDRKQDDGLDRLEEYWVQEEEDETDEVD
jgi:hypothetical protein